MLYHRRPTIEEVRASLVPRSRDARHLPPWAYTAHSPLSYQITTLTRAIVAESVGREVVAYFTALLYGEMNFRFNHQD